jgi:probable FeS assembly SUF system protein SufT
MPETKSILLSHDCQVIQIPNGLPSHLAKGTPVWVMQFLGTSYTVSIDRGQMFRLDARDADALGLSTIAIEDTPRVEVFREEMIWEQLKTVFDPEIPVNIADLGLIYSATVMPLESDGKRVEIKMSMTAPGCGMGNVLKADVESKLSRLPEVREVHVEVVFDPPWHPGMMSEAAKLQLGFDLDYGTTSSEASAFRVVR